MSVSIAIKSLLAASLDTTGLISRRALAMAGRRDVILMYHRVLPPDVAAGVQKGMYVEPATFESHLAWLTDLFDVIPLDDYLARRGARGESVGRKPLCMLTFDDGWKDFHDHAYPALKEARVPATMFLPTDYIGTNEWFWTDRLSHVLAGRASGARSAGPARPSSNPLVRRIEGLGPPSDRTLEEAIRMLMACSHEAIHDAIAELSERTGACSTRPPGRAFLTWTEVREIAGSGFISFGSHTASHRILTALPEVQIREEMVSSRCRLIDEGVTSGTFVAFSYPNGNFNGKIASMAADAGYGLAVTTEAGWNGTGADPFALRRIAIHQDMAATVPLFGCRVLNIL